MKLFICFFLLFLFSFLQLRICRSTGCQSYLKYLQLDPQENHIPKDFRLDFRNAKVSHYFILGKTSLDIYSSKTLKQIIDRVYVSDLFIGNLIQDLGKVKEGYCFMIRYAKLKKLVLMQMCANSLKLKEMWIKCFNKFVPKISSPKKTALAVLQPHGLHVVEHAELPNMSRLVTLNHLHYGSFPKDRHHLNQNRKRNHCKKGKLHCKNILEQIEYIDKKPKYEYRKVFDAKHPQKFIPCIQKDGDILYERSIQCDRPKGITSRYIPVRLSINMDTSTLSIKLAPDDELFSLDLERIIEVSVDKMNSSCFIMALKDGAKHKFCEMPGNNAPRQKAVEWIEDIKQFIKSCPKNIKKKNCKQLTGYGYPSLFSNKSYQIAKRILGQK